VSRVARRNVGVAVHSDSLVDARDALARGDVLIAYDLARTMCWMKIRTVPTRFVWRSHRVTGWHEA
jgi:hypothetical protein